MTGTVETNENIMKKNFTYRKTEMNEKHSYSTGESEEEQEELHAVWTIFSAFEMQIFLRKNLTVPGTHTSNRKLSIFNIYFYIHQMKNC